MEFLEDNESLHLASLKLIRDSLKDTRIKFDAITKDEWATFEAAVSLYFQTLNLTGRVVKSSDKELASLEVLGTAVKRVISSLSLLESGFPEESRMILRNCLEFILISIDIIHNNESLKKWLETSGDVLETAERGEWYFKASKIEARVREDKDKIYPDIERKMVSDIYREWKIISNAILHAHSKAQLKSSVKDGILQVMSLSGAPVYKNIFRQYSVFVFNIVNVLIGISRYRRLISESEELLEESHSVLRSYKEVKDMIVKDGGLARN
ncbi:MAG: hypothetical protein HYR95_00235 [Candidatus Colwellbacteria bacterium]|nr:hypothetical protein [Candidatus Colwellbacteria bacterium]